MQAADLGTKSQPTLNALWQKPGPQAQQRVRQPLGYPMRPPQNLPQPPLPQQTDPRPSQSPAGSGRRLPPSWDNSQSARAAGWIKAATPSPVAPLPGLDLALYLSPMNTFAKSQVKQPHTAATSSLLDSLLVFKAKLTYLATSGIKSVASIPNHGCISE